MVLHQHLFKLLSKFRRLLSQLIQPTFLPQQLHKQLLPFFNGEFWWCIFWILLIQFLYQLWCRLSFRYHFGSKYLGDHSTSLEVYRFAREITKHYSHTPATIPNFRVHWYHIDTYWDSPGPQHSAHRALCHSSGTVSISDSFSAWTTQSIVGIPIITGTLRLNSLPSLITRAT